jgi:hypothetical protein
VNESPDDAAWGRALMAVTDGAHLVTGDQLSALADSAVRELGMRAELLVVDLAQETLRSLTSGAGRSAAVDGTPPGRCYQLTKIVRGADEGASSTLWVPLLDGTERVGVLHLSLAPEVRDDEGFRRRCASLAGLLGHIVMTKLAYSDHLRALRSGAPLSVPSELLWQLVPPRTFASGDVVISALLEPFDVVAGDLFDYAVDHAVVDLAVYDGVGHDLAAGLTTAMAATAVRNARRGGVGDLAEVAARADELLVAPETRLRRFVTAVMLRLDLATGQVQYLLAGHPPPLLVRDGRIIGALDERVQPPLGVLSPGGRAPAATDRLEPGDRLLAYSDGITEARDEQGRFFGLEQLIEFTERAEQDQVSAPETLRRLGAAVLAHQHGRLQDDATLVMLDWSTRVQHRLLPTDVDGPRS